MVSKNFLAKFSAAMSMKSRSGQWLYDADDLGFRIRKVRSYPFALCSKILEPIRRDGFFKHL